MMDSIKINEIKTEIESCIRNAEIIDSDYCDCVRVKTLKTMLDYMHENYDLGYQQALNDINKPKKPIIEYCEYSRCPRCDKSFIDFENCNYDLIERAKFMDRCPYCGQALKWPST